MFKRVTHLLIFTFISIQLTANKADWTIQFSTTGQISIKDVVIDADGYSYSTGIFYDTLFIYSVKGLDTLIDKSFGETFIIKMDSCGNLIWAKQFFGHSSTEPYSITLNSTGHIITTGRFAALTDFDPSNNTFLVDPAGGNAIYISILDKDGNFVNVGRLGGSPGMYTPYVALDKFDNIYIAAAFSGGFQNNSVDVDPDLNNTYMLTPQGVDGIILKLNPLGDLNWVYHIKSIGAQILAGDITLSDSSLSASFSFRKQILFDKESGSQYIEAALSTFDGIIINLSLDKTFLSYSHLKKTGNISTKLTKSSTKAGTYLTSFFTDSLILFLKSDSIVLKSKGNYDSYVSHLSPSGEVTWVQQVSSKENVVIRSITTASNGNIYVSGIFRDTLSFGQNSNLKLYSNDNNIFIAVLDSNGSFIEIEQLKISTAKRSLTTLDSKDNIYLYSNFSTAFLIKYDGDTNFIKIGSENALLLKLSNEANRINLGSDKIICDEDSILLKPNLVENDEIKWSTGESTPSITVKQAGTYHVKVINCGKVYRDTIVITTVPKPIVDLGPDTTVCEGVPLLIEPLTQNVKRFVWNTNDTTGTLFVGHAGEYILRVENGPSCFALDTINIKHVAKPTGLPIRDTVLCGIDQYLLDAGNTASIYLWSNGETTQKINVDKDGIYTVIINNFYCTIKDSVEVTFLEEDECLPSITIPNIFTPNNDGNNDLFILDLKNILKAELRIYNRWGHLVYISDSKNMDWDGRFQGRELPEGSYLYVLQYSYSEWGEKDIIFKQKEGTVMLLR